MLENGREKVDLGREKVKVGREKVKVGREKVKVGREKVKVEREKVKVRRENVDPGRENHDSVFGKSAHFLNKTAVFRQNPDGRTSGKRSGGNVDARRRQRVFHVLAMEDAGQLGAK